MAKKKKTGTDRFDALPPGARQAALEVTSSPENAWRFLRANGFITDKGKLAPAYRNK